MGDVFWFVVGRWWWWSLWYVRRRIKRRGFAQRIFPVESESRFETLEKFPPFFFFVWSRRRRWLKGAASAATAEQEEEGEEDPPQLQQLQKHQSSPPSSPRARQRRPSLARASAAAGRRVPRLLPPSRPFCHFPRRPRRSPGSCSPGAARKTEREQQARRRKACRQRRRRRRGPAAGFCRSSRAWPRAPSPSPRPCRAAAPRSARARTRRGRTGENDFEKREGENKKVSKVFLPDAQTISTSKEGKKGERKKSSYPKHLDVALPEVRAVAGPGREPGRLGGIEADMGLAAGLALPRAQQDD